MRKLLVPVLAVVFLLTLSPFVSAQTMRWDSIGPGVYGALWGVAFHPTDPNTMMAGLDMGLAFLTHDGGKSWSAVGEMGKTPMGQPAYRGGWGIAFDPKRPQIIWIASEHGVSKSADGGKTWALQFGGPATVYDAIAIDPTDPDIVYIGEGRSVRVGVSWTTGYIHKTVDGGRTWTRSRPGGELGIDPVRARNWSRLVIDPQSRFLKGQGHQRLYAVGQGGFFVSEDAGVHWTSLEEKMPGGVVDLARQNEYGNKAVHTSGICDLTLLPGKDRGVLFATFQVVPVPGGTPAWRGGAYRSDDGGEHWTAKNTGLEPTLTYMSTEDFHLKQGLAFGYAMIASTPANPHVLYFGCYNGVFKSVDQGEHWTLMTHPNSEWRTVPTPDGKTMYEHVRKPGGNFRNASWGSLAAFNGLAVAPSNAAIVAYTDNNGVGLSRDGGQSWDEPFFEYGTAYKPGKFPGTIPMRLTHRTRAHGAQLVVPNALAIDPFHPNTLAVGYCDIGLQISRDGGTWWEWGWEGVYPNSEQNNCTAVLYDPENENRLYMATGRGATGKVYRSEDGGLTFRPIGIPALAQLGGSYVVHDLLLDPSSSAALRTLYAATSKGIFKTIDDGDRWENISAGLGTGVDVGRLAIDPQNPQRLYAGSYAYGRATADAGLYRSEDGGQHWQRLQKKDIGAIRTISICNNQPNTIVISALPPGVTGTWAFATAWRSDDYGNTWMRLDTRRCSCVAVHPHNPRIFYMGTWAADVSKEPVDLWRSMDSGNTWARIDQGATFTLGFLDNDRICFDPRDAQHLFVLTSTGVLEARDTMATH